MMSQGSGTWMMSQGYAMSVGQDGEGSDEAKERWGLRRLSFGFSFEHGKA
jgi:hypothetical protein